MSRIYKHTNNYVVKEIGDEKVLIPLHNNIADMEQIYTLNETASFIWEKMNGINTVDDIAAQLAEEFDIDIESAISDIHEFVSEMREFLETN